MEFKDTHEHTHTYNWNKKIAILLVSSFSSVLPLSFPAPLRPKEKQGDVGMSADPLRLEAILSKLHLSLRAAKAANRKRNDP